jgi:uncharacterized protein (TIGR03435 family)
MIWYWTTTADAAGTSHVAYGTFNARWCTGCGQGRCEGRRAYYEDMNLIRLLCALGVMATPLSTVAQTGTSGQRSVTFEVASIKRHASSSPSPWKLIPSPALEGISGNLFRVQARTLSDLVRDAYMISEFQLSGGPSWAAPGGDQYDIVARTGQGKPSEEQVRLMLRGLLAERFHLKYHREQKVLPVYELVIANGGPKLKVVRADAKPLDRSHLGPNGPVRAPIQMIITVLSEFVDQAIVDKTGLPAAQYEYTFDTREQNSELRYGRPVPSIFRALQDQLGLKLQAGKARIEMFVIDHAEQPSEN